MKISKKTILSFIIIFLALTIFSYTKAQNTIDSISNPEISNEEIIAENLEVKEPSLLPDNPFYFLKEWIRNIRMTFTSDETKKADLENKFSNERLVELKKMIENKSNPDVIKKATEKYQEAINKIKERVDKIKENTEEKKVNSFLEKFTNHQILHQRILEKLEGKVPEEVLEKIKETRERHIEKFSEVMQKLEKNKDKIVERIENIIEKNQTNNRIIERINQKMPDDVRTKINARIQKREKNK